jgi:hypothetical protein
MNSESVKNILPALAAAIAAMPDPKKNKSNSHFNNKYADLGAVLECIYEPLAANDLVLTQVMDWDGTDSLLRTILWHTTSGEHIDSVSRLLPDKNTPQGVASAITYARRYAIKALFGMHDVDDDGNAASAPPPQKSRLAGPQRTEPKPAVLPFADAKEAAEALDASLTLTRLEEVVGRIKVSPLAEEEKRNLRDAHAGRKKVLVDLGAKV